MLVGYNTNVPFKGNLYHVQTEDSGKKNPVIITLLYLSGTILSSKKVSYADIADSPDYKEKVREMMKEQHKAMIKELIRGIHTQGVPPGPAAVSGHAKEEPPPSPPGESSAPLEQESKPEDRTQKGQISKSLDDVLLDFIMKRRD